jgi:regulatory protein
METEEERTKAMKFAMKLIGLRRRSEQELRGRLREKGFPPELEEEVVAEMKRFRYLDDAAFAESYIHDRLRFRPAGRFVLRMELKNKGLREELIEEKLAELIPSGTELEMAEKVAAKKLRLLGRMPADKRRLRLLNFLRSKGFGAEAISQAVKNTIESEQDTNLED